MPSTNDRRPRKRNDDKMDKEIEEFYATLPDGEYPVAEIQKMKPHPMQISVESPPAKQQAKQRIFQGRALEPVAIKPTQGPGIESHDAHKVMMIFEGGKLVAFRYPDGSRRKVTQLHTKDD